MRLLVVIPLLLVAEVEARNFLPTVVQEFRAQESAARRRPAALRGRRCRRVAAAQFGVGRGRPDRARLCRVHGHHLAAVRVAVRQHLVRGDHVRRLRADTGRLLVRLRQPADRAVPVAALVPLDLRLGALPVAGVAHPPGPDGHAPRSRRRTRLPRKLGAHLRHGGGGAWGGGGRADRQPDPVQGRRAARIRRRAGHGRRLGDRRGLRPVAVLRAATGGGEEGSACSNTAGWPIATCASSATSGWNRARAPTKR